MLSKVRPTNYLSSFRQLSKLATTFEALDQRGDVANLTNLKNGFRVASYLNNRPTATVGIWVDAGSRSETSENNGVASIFEILIHTGSAQRNSMQLQKDLAKLGANLVSFTTREHSAFLVECLSNDVEQVLGILADVMCNAQIETAKVEEQRANALKRLEKFEEEDHKGVVMDYLHMTAYHGTPMSLSPLGNTQAINSLTVDSVKNYVNDIYKPCRMVLSCAGGGIDHENIQKMAEKYFGALNNNYDQKVPLNYPPTNREGYEHIVEPRIRFSGSEFLYRDDNYPYMYGALAVEGVPRGHIDYLALEVAKSFVGQWDRRTYAASANAPSSIIQKLTANQDMVGFESFNISYDNTGLFGVYFLLNGLDLDTCQAAIRQIQRGWKHLAMGVTDGEVERAKNAMKTNLFSQLETNTQIANYVAKEVFANNKIIPMDQLERKIHYIDTSGIREAVSRHIYDREIACAGIGRVEAWPVFQEMRYAMSWWRL